MKYQETFEKTKKNWDAMAKPIDALGCLEEIVCRINAVTGDANRKVCPKCALLVLCGDHGVVAEGVTQTDSSVTKIVAENFAKGLSSVNMMAKVAGADVFPVDVGMDCEPYDQKTLKSGYVTDRKIARATNNLKIEAAMSGEQFDAAVRTGINLVQELKSMGYEMVATGEMGIGNTTPTAVMTAAFLGLDAEQVTGRGAGLDDASFAVKRAVITEALDRIRGIEGFDKSAARLISSEGGGYEIAVMTGIFIGGLKYEMPVIIDGVISSVAALAAVRMDENVKRVLIASHMSMEPAMVYIMQEMECSPIINADMHLGEGSGCMAIIPLIKMAYAVYAGLGSFGDFGIEEYERYE